ncbi:MAG: hypothetical protein HYT77_03560 [Deltaproteobacteria bacterium]|nr:hypothetical protein [Deltaproteobacteria bacterium]
MANTCDSKLERAWDYLRDHFGLYGLPNDKYMMLPWCPDKIAVKKDGISIQRAEPRKSGGIDILDVYIKCQKDSCDIIARGVPIKSITVKSLREAQLWLSQQGE